MGPFTALMTVDNAVNDTAAGKRSFFRTAAGAFRSIRNEVSNRRLRDQLADMDDAMLKDIGIADDEIHMIRARNRFTPRAWAHRSSGRNWQA